jgi:choline dehydrogenase
VRDGLTADYVVVGAGAAGCALAEKLSEDGRHEVLLLETGPRARHPLVPVPMGFVVTMHSPRLTHTYVTEPLANGQEQVWLRGRGLGGSTTINGSMYLRGEPAYYERLGAELGPSWGWHAWERAFEEVERHLPVSRRSVGDGVEAATADALAAAGMPGVADLNAATGPRSGPTPTTIRDGRRTTAAAFLSRARRRTNLRVVTGARAVRLQLDGWRATGVVTAHGNSAVVHRARREIVLCAGALESPLLLERSGIGSSDVLRRCGIKPLVASASVGEGLVEQRQVTVKVRLRTGLGVGPQLATPARVAAQAARYLLTGGGPVGAGPYELTALAASDPGGDPDLQILATMLATDDTGLRVAPYAGLMMQGYVVRPGTSGSVHVGGPRPGDAPRIDAGAMDTDEDRRRSRVVLERIREVLATPALADAVLGEEVPGAHVLGEDAVARHVLDAGAGIFHAVGSCAMGSGEDAVVDARLRVRGVEGLRIADTSVFPQQPSGGTAAPTMALGRLAGALLLRDGG